MPDDLTALERHLELLARATRYPDAPPLADAVRRRIEAGARPAPQRIPRWTLAGAALAAAAALALLLGLWAPGREAVADLFDRLLVFRTDESPAGLPRDIVGTPVSLSAAEQRLGLPLVEPTYPEGLELERVLLQEFEGFDAAVLFYEHPTSGLSFALFQTSGLVGKGLPVGAEAEPVVGLGREAYWLEGLRFVQYYDERGQLIQESRRATDANTLIWDEAGFVFRLEGDLSRDGAIEIAHSLR